MRMTMMALLSSNENYIITLREEEKIVKGDTSRPGPLLANCHNNSSKTATAKVETMPTDVMKLN